ncbi:MAG: hypothetical protein LC748_13700 [Thermomicrobia bacterium]|nr:hypothetical protein [Thermomicrobia bacterium]
MYTETSVVMHGPRERIFALGAAIEDWPLILPHYRSVRLTEQSVQSDGTVHKIAVMKAWRLLPFGKIPVGWKTIQESNAKTGLLHFVHIGGFTKGMVFVDAIARRTLACIKAMVEAGGNVTPQPPLLSRGKGEGEHDATIAARSPLPRHAGAGLGVGAIRG